MNFSEIWIRKPVMTSLVMMGILFFGLLSYKNLPVNELPNVEYPVVVIYAFLPGASADTVSSTVALPLEKQLSTLNGLQSMTSSSQQGYTSITLTFNLNRNIDTAVQDVNSKISAALGDMPTLSAPPLIMKVNPADQPIMYYVLTSKTLPLTKLNDYAETIFSQNLTTLDGVAEIKIIGANKEAIRVQLDPNQLALKKIGLNEVAAAINAANSNLPGGVLDSPLRTYAVQPNGHLEKADEYKSVVVNYVNKKPIYLSDIATVKSGVEYEKFSVTYVNKTTTEKAIVFAIKKQPGANTVKVAQSVKEAVPGLKAYLPSSVQVRLFYDKSDFIKESIDDVQFTMILTLFLVILVIFAFLKAFRPTIIPSIAIVLSIIGTFAVMKMLDYSLNTLSLMALTLSIGFVVDDAIVMLENVIRRMELGEDSKTASLLGSKEIGFTIISMTLSLVVVFIPMLFMGDLIGRLFREFSVTIAVSILISGFISLTLTPMMCSLLLKNYKENNESTFNRILDGIFNAFKNGYAASLQTVLRHKFLTLMSLVLVLIAMGYLFIIIPKGFIPARDQNFISGQTMASEDTTFSTMSDHQSVIQKKVIEDPDIEGILSVVGDGSATNTGQLITVLKEKSHRKRGVDQIINELRPTLDSVPGIASYLMNPPAIYIPGSDSGRGLYQFALQSNDQETLYKYVPMMEAKLRALPAFMDVNTDLQLKRPTLEIIIDRYKAATLGISVKDIEEALGYAYTSQKVSTVYGKGNTYKVILEMDPEYRNDQEDLGNLLLKTKAGTLIPLKTITNIHETVGPLTVNHVGQMVSTTFSFNLKPGVSMGEATQQINDVAKHVLPDTVTLKLTGATEAMSSSFKSITFLLIITVLVIYMVLGILYESYIHPITILTALPPAAFGALLSLFIFHLEFDLYAFVGLIMLIGIVKKNGIMMIDFALELEKSQHIKPEQAIYEACLIRFRPIMMTTLAALFGTLPIAIGLGAGGESRMPLGVAVVGGLFFSQFLTLYVTPIFYIYLSKLKRS